MKILITGPSCSGKTTIGRACDRGELVHLDQVDNVGDLLATLGDREHRVFEGLPSGSDQCIAAFRDRMDRVVVLTVPFATRLARMIERDGPQALGRFLYNEFAWRSHLAGPFAASAKVRHLRPEKARTLLAR